MELLFLGVGEACDENFPNTSILVHDKNTVLLDCGFSVPHNFFKYYNDPNELDIIWISHFHGDHFLGTPLMILRFWEMGRVRPLYFVGQEGLEEKIKTAMELAYPSFLKKLKYDIIFIELKPMDKTSILNFSFQTTYTNHSIKNMALRLEGSKSLYYSGDGKPAPESILLARECDLIIHECFLIKGELEGHGSLEMAIDFTQNAGVKKLAIVHMQRDERKKLRLKEINSKGIELFAPDIGEKILL